MDSKEISAKPLLETDLHLSQTSLDNSQKNFVEQYNLVVDCYNSDPNQIGLKMSKMHINLLYFAMIRFMKSFLGKFLITILIIATPFLNIIIYLTIIAIGAYHTTYNRVFAKNHKLINDPFEKMVYAPEICKSLKKDYWLMELNINQSEGLVFNQESIDRFKQRSTDDNVKFIIYNNSFWGYYHRFPENKQFHDRWFVYGTICLLISSVVYIFLWIPLIFEYKLWRNNM